MDDDDEHVSEKTTKAVAEAEHIETLIGCEKKEKYDRIKADILFKIDMVQPATKSANPTGAIFIFGNCIYQYVI